MGRTVGTRLTVSTIVLDVLLTIILALVLLTVWRGVASGSVDGSLGQASQRLFLFMDIGLLAWVILLGAAAGRGRSAGAGLTLVFAAVGTLANLVAVIVVGFVQQGTWAEQFILFAIEAGIAVLLAAAAAVLLVHRLILKPSSPRRNPS